MSANHIKRFFLGAAFAGFVALPAWSAPVEVSDAVAERDNVADLKQAAFERLRDLHAFELQSGYPERTRVSLYIGVLTPRFRVEKINVSFDGQAPRTYTYTAKQARLLAGNYLHRPLRVNLAPGAHTVTITYSGLLERALLGEKPVTETVTVEFEKTEAAKSVVVPLSPPVLIGSLQEESDTWATLWQDEDPRLAMVRFQRETDREYDALIDLLAMAGSTLDSEVLPLAYDIELAHSYVDFGMREQADQAMRVAYDTGVNLDVLADVWLRIAELDYERGNLSRAFELLQYLRSDLTPAQLVIWQDILSRLYMSEGEFDQAREVLEIGDNGLEVLTEANLPTNQTPTMRFNYAVTLIKQGEHARGRTLLERIGRVTDFGEDQRTLRDKANLLLGYQFLKSEQGATAKNILERIRLDGPYSNEALLALGWTELAPHGTRQPRAAVGDEPELGAYGSRNAEAGRIIKAGQNVRLRDDPFSRIQLGPFELADMAQTERKATGRALIAWTEAASQNSQDPAVQEALVVRPYALSKLGKLDEALDDYLQAVATLEQTRAELNGYAKSNVDLDAIERGELDALPDAPWMLQLLAGDKFQEHFQNYLTLIRMRNDLRRLATYGNQGLSLRLSDTAQNQESERVTRLGKLRESLSASAARQARFAQAVVVKEIEDQREALDEYLISARLGAASFQEELKGKR